MKKRNKEGMIKEMNGLGKSVAHTDPEKFWGMCSRGRFPYKNHGFSVVRESPQDAILMRSMEWGDLSMRWFEQCQKGCYSWGKGAWSDLLGGGVRNHYSEMGCPIHLSAARPGLAGVKASCLCVRRRPEFP